MLVLLLSTCLAGEGYYGAKNLYPIEVTQHKAMHWIAMIDGANGAGCTAYAIAPHVLLTAEHCNLPVDVVLVDPTGVIDHNTANQSVFAHAIAEKVYDHKDHMLLVVPNETFKDTVIYDPSTYRVPIQGEEAYSWGNPNGIRDQYRQGYVMGIVNESVPNVNEDTPDNAPVYPMYLFNWFAMGGDSGSVVFSKSDNRILTVVTYGIVDGHAMGGFALEFTEKEVQQAKSIKGVGDKKK
jgi:hypothetical protein